MASHSERDRIVRVDRPTGIVIHDEAYWREMEDRVRQFREKCDGPTKTGYVMFRTEGRNVCLWCGQHRGRGKRSWVRADWKACVACFKLIEAIRRLEKRTMRMTGRDLTSVLGQVTMANRSNEGFR